MSKEEKILKTFLRIYSIELSTKEENIIIPESIPAIKERLKELKNHA